MSKTQPIDPASYTAAVTIDALQTLLGNAQEALGNHHFTSTEVILNALDDHAAAVTGAMSVIGLFDRLRCLHADPMEPYPLPPDNRRPVTISAAMHPAALTLANCIDLLQDLLRDAREALETGEYLVALGTLRDMADYTAAIKNALRALLLLNKEGRLAI